MELHRETSAVEMGTAMTAACKGQKPFKSKRRRINCTALPANAERQSRRTPTPPDGQDHTSELPVTPNPLVVIVRILYFSRDGNQADNGDAYEIPVTTATTGQELLEKARAATGATHGHLLYKMKKLCPNAMIGEYNVVADPAAFHLVLSRKHRPPEVAANAAAELAKVEEHTAAAAAAGPPRRQRAERAQSPARSEMMDEFIASECGE